ncbi:hypothetical protein [Romboutsia sp.]|uniref:hypothetical protein n=1 Tax=Romboutsia sp. TaxID=1965302 RepID=UPI003F384AA6
MSEFDFKEDELEEASLEILARGKLCFPQKPPGVQILTFCNYSIKSRVIRQRNLSFLIRQIRDLFFIK